MPRTLGLGRDRLQALLPRIELGRAHVELGRARLERRRARVELRLPGDELRHPALEVGERPLALGEVGGDALQRLLAVGGGRLAPIDGCAQELDRTELAASLGELALRLLKALLAPGELGGERGQLGVAVVELGRAVPQHLLDGGAKTQRLLLAALEVGDRGVELLGAQLELAAALVDQLLDLLRLVGGGEERLQPEAPPVVRLPARRPVLPVPIRLPCHAPLSLRSRPVVRRRVVVLSRRVRRAIRRRLAHFDRGHAAPASARVRAAGPEATRSISTSTRALVFLPIPSTVRRVTTEPLAATGYERRPAVPRTSDCHSPKGSYVESTGPHRGTWHAGENGSSG